MSSENLGGRKGNSSLGGSINLSLVSKMDLI